MVIYRCSPVRQRDRQLRDIDDRGKAVETRYQTLSDDPRLCDRRAVFIDDLHPTGQSYPAVGVKAPYILYHHTDRIRMAITKRILQILFM